VCIVNCVKPPKFRTPELRRQFLAELQLLGAGCAVLAVVAYALVAEFSIALFVAIAVMIAIGGLTPIVAYDLAVRRLVAKYRWAGTKQIVEQWSRWAHLCIDFVRDPKGVIDVWFSGTRLGRKRAPAEPVVTAPKRSRAQMLIEREQARFNDLAQEFAGKGWPRRVVVDTVTETPAGYVVAFHMFGAGSDRDHVNAIIKRMAEPVAAAHDGALSVRFEKVTETAGKIFVNTRNPFDAMYPNGIVHPSEAGRPPTFLPSVGSVSEPYDLGRDSVDNPVHMWFEPGQPVLIIGVPGAGKSNTMQWMLRHLFTRTDVVVRLCDMEGGTRTNDFAPFARHFREYVAIKDTARVASWLSATTTAMIAEAEASIPEGTTVRKLPIDDAHPMQIVMVDGLGRFDDGCWSEYLRMIEELRKFGVVVVGVMQSARKGRLSSGASDAVDYSRVRVFLGGPPNRTIFDNFFPDLPNGDEVVRHLRSRVGAGFVERPDKMGRPTRSMYLGWKPGDVDRAAALLPEPRPRPTVEPPEPPQDRRTSPRAWSAPHAPVEGVARGSDQGVTSGGCPPENGVTTRVRDGVDDPRPPDPLDRWMWEAWLALDEQCTHSELSERLGWDSRETRKRRAAAMKKSSGFRWTESAQGHITWRRVTAAEHNEGQAA
jgi:energy-coupling factor transporter ATP-binding protein EcfA2